MPYDPQPLDTARESLTVQVQGGRGEPERVYILARPVDDRVEVREFATSCAAPREYVATADELYDRFARALRQRRRVSEELYRIRLWLDGLA